MQKSISKNISNQKRLIFSIITVSFPILLFIILELILWISVPSLDNPLVTEVSYDNIEWYQINRDYLKTYFPINSRLIPEFKPSLFKKEKNPELFRVFCLGGSSMFGTPYQMTCNIPGIIRRQLRHIFPDREIEVVNFGASAINSHVIKQFAGELLEFQPDLILIYMGHNEFYGPDGVGATYLEKNIPLLTSLKHQLRKIRTYQLMRRWIESSISSQTANPERNLMREVSQGSEIHLYSADAERVFHSFQNNLEVIIKIFRNKNIPVIVSDVTSNLLFQPFSYPKIIDGQEIDQRLITSAAASHNEKHLLALYHKDSTHALVNFGLGKYYLAEKNLNKALYHLSLARDEDLLKFRAPSKINRIIENLCTKLNIPHISSDQYFTLKSDNILPGYDLFWEHLHPNLQGYYLIAEVFVRKILDFDLLKANITTSSPLKLLPNNPDSLYISWLDLAYADLSIQNLTGKWPFQDFKVQAKFLGAADQKLKDIVNDVYQRKIVWDEACYRVAFLFEKQGRYQDAETTYKAILEEYPTNFYAHYQLGRIYKELNRLSKAAHHYTLSIQANADYLFSRLELGMIMINLGEFDESIQHLKEAQKQLGNQKNTVTEATIFYGLSAAFANKNDYATAVAYVKQALTIAPNYDPAVELHQQLLRFKQNQN
jgi:tetratricopeptide (TPR) repeat protein